MDKAIEAEVVNSKKKKTFVIVLLLIVVFIAAIVALRSALSSTIKKSVITTAVVEQGDIENTITASGEILPEFEATITSPINASLQKVIIDAGSKVKAGESILTLDKSASQTEFEKLKFQLASKENDVKKLNLITTSSNFESIVLKQTLKMQNVCLKRVVVQEKV